MQRKQPLFPSSLLQVNYTMKKIFLSLFSFAALVVSAQKVSPKLLLQKGQKFEVTTNTNTTAETPMGDNTGSTVGIDVYEVKDVTANGATIERSKKKMKLSFSMMGQEKTIDSDKPEDLEGTFGEPIKEMMNTKDEFTVDANGMITAVKGDNKKKANNNGMAAMLTQQLNPGAAVLKPGIPSFFKFFPNSEVDKGDSWTDSLSAEGTSTKTVSTVKDITGNEILVDYIGNGTIDAKKEMMGMSVDVKGNSKSNGTVTLDKTTGLIKQKTDTMLIDTTANLGGQEMNIKTKMTSVITVKVL